MAESLPVSEPSRSPTEFVELMQAITACRTTLTDKVHTELGLIRRDLDTFRGCMAEVEQRVSSTEDVQMEHSVDLRVLKTKVKHLEARVEDPENQNRRNNLRVLGLPEGAEGNDLIH